jgi:quercetin dioxygenase-like cupin family protein
MPFVLKAGDSNYVARGTVHRQQNLSDKPARYIVINIFDKGKPTAEPVPE